MAIFAGAVPSTVSSSKTARFSKSTVGSRAMYTSSMTPPTGVVALDRLVRDIGFLNPNSAGRLPARRRCSE